MIFGSTDQFAVEAILEPGPEYPVVQSGNLAGRIRVWMTGLSVGHFEEPSCWLGPPRQHLVDIRERLDDLWDPSFDVLSPEQIFRQLDFLNFGVEPSSGWSSNSARQSPREIVAPERFSFLLHSSEAFDDWKLFLVHPPSSMLMALVTCGDSETVVVRRFASFAFSNAIDLFDSWLTEQARVLVPHLGGA